MGTASWTVRGLAVIVTPLFNSSRGSILLPALFHLQVINPIWPDAQPWDTLFFVGRSGWDRPSALPARLSCTYGSSSGIGACCGAAATWATAPTPRSSAARWM